MQMKPVRNEPPEGGWGWIVVMGVSLVNLSTRPIEPSFGLLFGDLITDLGIATTGAGIIVSVYEAVVNFSGLLVGPLIKRYSYRVVAIIGGFLAGLGLIATYPAASMAHILCTYSVINGLGVGFSLSATFVSLNHYFKKRRGQAVGITMTGTGLGLLLMPQAIRYLTEEYDFAGSVLILGAFALNACVGASVLQPIKWHLRAASAEEGKLLKEEETKELNGNCPHITITHTIKENDEEEEVNKAEGEVKDSGEREGSKSKEKWIAPTRKWSVMSSRHMSITNDPVYGDKAIGLLSNKTMDKSFTESKLDKYFEDAKSKPIVRRKLSEISYNMLKRSYTHKEASNNSVHKSGEVIGGLNLNNVNMKNVRKRKASTISNLSNLDFTGSCLQIHAVSNLMNRAKLKAPTSVAPERIKHEHKQETQPIRAPSPIVPKKESIWSRIVNFMDLDLLKDPVFLNIMFGLSIFYIAELNFKMVVPFFLADLGHSKSETAFCLSMMAASDIVARVVLPPICDRVTKISRRTMFMVATIFCALSRSALAEVGDWIQLETILIISGFFRGATLINFMLVISEYCDGRMDKLPAAFGLHMVAKGIFIAAFGPLIGLIRDQTGSYPLCIHAQTGCILLCSIAWTLERIIVFFKNHKKP